MATWREIKEAVEALGVKDEDEVAWIDIGDLPYDAQRVDKAGQAWGIT
jgi:hypothetical protein